MLYQNNPIMLGYDKIDILQLTVNVNHIVVPRISDHDHKSMHQLYTSVAAVVDRFSVH